VEVTDDAGRIVRLEAPARRVVALYGAFAETLLALGGRDRLVARTSADVQPDIADLPSIGTHMRPDPERVLACRPDLVLQLAGRHEALQQSESLRRLGLVIAVFSLDGFEDLFRVTRHIGTLCGLDAAAKDLVAAWEHRLEALRSRRGNTPAVSVFYEVRYPNLLAAGTKGIVHEIIEAGGGRNVVETPRKLVRLGEEALIDMDPDVYILQKGPMNPDPVPLGLRPHFRGLAAVKTGRVFEVEEAVFARPGPHSLDAAERLEGMLHGVPQRKGEENPPSRKGSPPPGDGRMPEGRP
jgi:iron complex transport system substrate-binding protein